MEIDTSGRKLEFFKKKSDRTNHLTIQTTESTWRIIVPEYGMGKGALWLFIMIVICYNIFPPFLLVFVFVSLFSNEEIIYVFHCRLRYFSHV